MAHFVRVILVGEGGEDQDSIQYLRNLAGLNPSDASDVLDGTERSKPSLPYSHLFGKWNSIFPVSVNGERVIYGDNAPVLKAGDRFVVEDP